jgi:hypothetical protein
MQATSLLQNVEARTKVQVVCITQDNLGFDIVLNLAGVDSFNRTHRAHGHKNGGLYFAMGGGNYTGAGVAFTISSN